MSDVTFSQEATQKASLVRENRSSLNDSQLGVAAILAGFADISLEDFTSFYFQAILGGNADSVRLALEAGRLYNGHLERNGFFKNTQSMAQTIANAPAIYDSANSGSEYEGDSESDDEAVSPVI